MEKNEEVDSNCFLFYKAIYLQLFKRGRIVLRSGLIALK